MGDFHIHHCDATQNYLSQMLHVWNIYAYIGVVWGVNVGIYGIRGAFGPKSAPARGVF